LRKKYRRKLIKKYLDKLLNNKVKPKNNFSYKLFSYDSRFQFLSLNLTYLAPLLKRFINHGASFNPYLYEIQDLFKKSFIDVERNVAYTNSELDPIEICDNYKWFYNFIMIDDFFFSGKGGS
jgi:hypothetical protein